MTRQGTAGTKPNGKKGYSSEELYRILFEQAADGILIADATGRYIEANPHCCEMLGYTREEMLKFSLGDLIAPADLQKAPLRLDELRTGKLVKSERSYRRKDGTYLPVEISSKMLSDGLILGLLRDISTRKRAEEEVLQLSRFPAENPNPVLRVSNEGEVLYANAASHELLEELATEVGGRLSSDWKEWISELAASGSRRSVDVNCKGRIYAVAIAPVQGTNYTNLYGSDVTEQRQAEIQIRASEERYRSLFDNMLDGFAYCQMIYENDQPSDFMYLKVNKNFEPLSGLKNVVGKKVSEVIPGFQDANPEILEIYGNVARMGIPQKFEAFIKPLELWLSISVYCPENGYFVAVFENITDRRNATETLQQAEQKYRSIFEHSLDGIYQSTASGRFLTVNPALARIWGYESPEELVNSITNIKLQVYVRPEQRDEFLRAIDNDDTVHGFEYQVYRKDGSIIWVQESVRAVRDKSGEVLYYEGTVRDITGQKQAEEFLRQSEERYRRTLNNMLEGCQIIDYDWRYIYINDAGAKHGRRKPEEILMRSMLELYPGIEKTELFAVLQSCMENRTPNRLENHFTFPDGDTGWFELSIEPVPEGLFILSVDITKRKLAEKKRIEAELFAQYTIDALTAHICVLDKDGVILSVNRAWHNFAEANPPVPPDHFVGANYLAVCEAARGEYSEEAASFAAGLRAVMQNEREHFSLEYPCNVPGGERRWFFAQVTRFTINDEMQIVVTHENISKRKIIEEALRDSEARFSTVFYSSPQSIAITRMRDNRLIDVNPAWTDATGIPREEAIGNTALELGTWFNPDERHRLIELLRNRGRVQGLEVQLHNRSGEISEILFSAELTELSGETHMVSIALDNSERKRAEKKIRQQLERLTALSEIDRVITSSFDLSLTLNLLLRHLVRQLEVDAAAILLANPVTNNLEYVAWEGFRSFSAKKVKLHIGEEYAGKVALERRKIHIPNLSTVELPFGQAYLAEKENFISYHGIPLVAKGQLKGVLEVFQRKQPDQDHDWLAYMEAMAEQAAIAIDNSQLFNNLQQSNAELTMAYDATIEGWSYALDLRDRETEGHTQRVTDMTTRLCKKFGLSDKEITYTRWGALLHDIGKMGIPDSILQKPDKLTDDEWRIMKMHPVLARKMLERVNYLKSAIDIPYCHHEKWDGSGYPRGLKGEQIPLPARIFAIVDVWDALTSDRPYRLAWSKSDALEYIKSLAGTHFEPQVVQIFLDSEDLWNNVNP